jgi:hypothetical protein
MAYRYLTGVYVPGPNTCVHAEVAKPGALPIGFHFKVEHALALQQAE